jgi:NADPH2:quinone reductase
MKAIQVKRCGGQEVMELADLPTPRPKTNEALIQIKASGVNFVDVYFREGRYPASLPFVIGQEAAGVVVEVGQGVEGLKPGDRVAYT